MVKVTCLHCRQEFNAKPADILRGKGKYCSKQCLADAKGFNKRIDATCRKCGTPFKYRPSEGNRIYCSIQCYHTSVPKIKKICKICENEFEVQPCYDAENRSLYCSSKCFGIAMRGREVWNKGKKGIFSEEVCKRISDANKGRPSPFKGIHNRYSEETRKKISDANRKRKGLPGRKHSEETKRKLSLHFTGKKRPELAGERHHMWKGGVAYAPYCNKFNTRFKERVREFFGNKCIRCGKTKYENKNALSVHHVDENKNTCCDGSKPLFVPLCSSCHGIVHTHKDKNWNIYFEDIINKDYMGKCYYTVDEYREILLSRL